MNLTQAFMNGQASRGNELMVFDWNKAARLIKERHPKKVAAGLKDDWGWTGGKIYDSGTPIKSEYTYLSSTWAVPEIDIDGEIKECYVMQHEAPRWHAGTKWPKSALEILES